MNLNSKIFITGHNGLVGNSILQHLRKKNFRKLFIADRKTLDLRNQNKVLNFFKIKKFDYVINCAGKVGGIYANSKYRADFIYDNIMMQNNVIYSSYSTKVKSLIFLGSIPLIFVGYIFYSTDLIYSLRNIEVIAWTTLIFGILLYISDKSKFDKKISTNLNFQSILFIGFFQTLSLIPGVSRAGITITAARILKFNRLDSGKISFLLSIPALSGASFLSLKDLSDHTIDLNYLVFLAIISSFIFSFLTVKFFLNYINKFSMNAFVIYRILIALVLFYIIY